MSPVVETLSGKGGPPYHVVLIFVSWICVTAMSRLRADLNF